MACRSSPVLWLVVLPAVFVLAGCSSGKKSFTVKGSVSYQGKPLSSGLVRLYMPDKRMAMARIHPDGSFEATDVYAGEVKATIEEDPLKKQERMMPVVAGGPATPAPKPSPAPSAPIPAKYKDTSTSGLVFTVTSGKQRLDIELQ